MTPASFGKYIVTELLGSGGMAEVYAGMHPDLGRQVAIKVILPQFAAQPDFEERFRREARLVASLRHAHIVQLHDFDVVEGRPFMVMEYLDGDTLKDQLRALQRQQERMPLARVAELLDALADALDYAHGRGAVHRDIKPANILFTAEQEPVLADFGIAKLLEEAVHLTATGGVVGSPFYMPPEQATGGEVDARGDQYALGVVLYELLTGRVPFQGSSAVAVMTQHLNSTPPAPRSLNADLPAAVEEVLLRVLAKQPAGRFDSAGALAHAFRHALPAPLSSSGAKKDRPQASSGAEKDKPLSSSGSNERHSLSSRGATSNSNARTVLTEPDGEAAASDAPTVTDAETVVSGDAERSTPAQAAETVRVQHEPSPAADQDNPAPPARQARSASEPAQLPAVDERREIAPRDNEQENEQDNEQERKPQPPSAHPPAQNVQVGSIQAGVVNQGGEQTFGGDLTFNLDFGASPPAPQPPAAGDAQPGPRATPELAALLDALRTAFAQNARVDRFVRLVTQFHTQLEALPPERVQDRNQVVKRVQALLLEMTTDDPDPDMVEIMGTSLERAVQPLARVDPDLSALATRITSWVDLMVQPE